MSTRAPQLYPDPDLTDTDGWRSRAACHQHPTVPPQTWDDDAPDEFGGHADRRANRIARAMAVCAVCPVRLACLADVDLGLDTGVRGGVDLRDERAAGLVARAKREQWMAKWGAA